MCIILFILHYDCRPPLSPNSLPNKYLLFENPLLPLSNFLEQVHDIKAVYKKYSSLTNHPTNNYYYIVYYGVSNKICQRLLLVGSPHQAFHHWPQHSGECGHVPFFDQDRDPQPPEH